MRFLNALAGPQTGSNVDSLFAILRRQAFSSDADDTLLARFAGGEEGAFAELVRRHGPLVYAAARRRLPDSADAADVFQATFLLLVRKAPRLAGRPTVGPWLYRTAALTARNLRRRNARRPVGLTAGSDPGYQTDATIRWDLDDALLALSERDRAAVVLCHLLGHSRQEAADRLGLPEGTLSTVLHRALRRLRVRLGHDPRLVLVAAGVAVPAGLATATERVGLAVWAAGSVGVGPGFAALSVGPVREARLVKLLVAGLVATGVGVGLMFHPAALPATPTTTRLPDLPTVPEARIRVGPSGDVEWGEAGTRFAVRDPAELRPLLDRLRATGGSPRVSLLADPAAPPDRLVAVARACAAGGFPTVRYAGPTPNLSAALGTETHDWAREGVAPTAVLVHLPTAFGLDAADGPAVALVGRLRGSVTRDHARPGRPVVAVSLADAPVADATLDALTSLSALHTLGLRHCGLTDGGLLALARLPALAVLDLSVNPGVTDAGMTNLQPLRRLAALDLRGTRVTAAGANRLRLRLPGCDIRH